VATFHSGFDLLAMDRKNTLLQAPDPPKWSGANALLLILGVGLLLRLVLLYSTSHTGLMIVDEQHYYILARNLLHGHGFAWAPGELTSLRPPLYPLFISLIWMASGTESLQLVRAVQIFLTLINVVLVCRLGHLLWGRPIALLAAAGFCFYPSLIAFDFLLLTETLFTLLLTLMALGYVVLTKTGRSSVAWATGCTLGLAALTRSVLWPLPVVLCPLTFFAVRGTPWMRVRITSCLFLGYALVVTPWAVRNTRLQGVTTGIDTMGGLNLRMGNYAHTPLHRAWDAISLSGEQSWAHDLRQEHPDASTWTEGRKEKWSQQKALLYMRENLLLTLKRSMVKFFNFWGLERTVIAGWQQGLYHPPRWFSALGTVLITWAYILTMLLASVGLFLAPPNDRRIHLFLILLVAFISGVHTVVFGHERYHVPLIPLLLLYAAAAVVQQSWRRFHEGIRTAAVPAVVCIVLLVSWGYEVFIVDAQRIRTLLQLLMS
jgi:4-amino-4-deoxy-L-arabinose transferase-like glycosyltransferase